jgi:hypothetical protein
MAAPRFVCKVFLASWIDWFMGGDGDEIDPNGFSMHNSAEQPRSMRTEAEDR